MIDQLKQFLPQTGHTVTDLYEHDDNIQGIHITDSKNHYTIHRNREQYYASKQTTEGKVLDMTVSTDQARILDFLNNRLR